MYDYTNNTPLDISNDDFLNCIFGKESKYAHVTDFIHDPSNIPPGEHLKAWMGNYYSRYKFQKKSNQYFTISLFNADEKGKARRRKVLYKSTVCIVLDDVKEKLPMRNVNMLPEPSWILETSNGSEQWGYILDQPCDNRSMVENLLDGLVEQGLAPQGKDPGMKGVTRYVRLPEGVNNKQSKLIGGRPFKCKMLVWEPFNRVAIEDLAEPFDVDLHAQRREGRLDGAANVPDHPLIDIDDVIHVKEIRSDGRYDITCPWVDEHTGEDDSGAAVFTNEDGSFGFKCHHGACCDRNGATLLNHIEHQVPGFKAQLTNWQVMRSFGAANKVKPFEEVKNIPAPPVSNITPEISTVVDNEYEPLLARLRSEPKYTDTCRDLAATILRSVDSIPEIQKIAIHEDVCHHMGWNKIDFKKILTDLRKTWYQKSDGDVSFFDEVVFIAEQNQFYDREKRIFYTAEAYQNTYAHLSENARKEALQGGMVTKVDRLDYAPLKPAVFKERGVTYANSWTDRHESKGVQGDVTRWLNHFKALGWEKEMDHILKWMAWTIRHPDEKINHMILLGSKEGGGKDFLLTPLITALGDGKSSLTISGDELLSDFNDYILSAKHLNINEAELGDRKEAIAVANKLKPLTAAPPKTLRLNQKSIKPIMVRNILSVTMTTNSQTPVKLSGTSRRIFAVWSDLVTRDQYDEMLPEWREYWQDRWDWMENGGVDASNLRRLHR